MSFFFIFFILIFFLKNSACWYVSLGQNLLLKFKQTWIKPEQSIPLKILPPHLYFIPLNNLISLKIFLSLYLIGFIFLISIHLFWNLANFVIVFSTLILDIYASFPIFFLNLNFYKYLRTKQRLCELVLNTK